MNNAFSDGNTITITGPATAGVPVIAGTVLAVPVATLASGESGAAIIDGPAFVLPKLSTAVVAQGAKLIWDVSASQVIVASAATGDLNNFGVAMAAAGNGATSVVAKLTPGVGALQA